MKDIKKHKDTATEARKKFIKAKKRRNVKDLFFPGPKDIYDKLAMEQEFRTIRETGTDHEDIWRFNGKIYERAEEQVRTRAHEVFMEMYKEMENRIESIPADKRNEFTQSLFGRIEGALHNGPREGQINEVLAMIRRTTFTDFAEMNPGGYIPFRNGLLDLKTRKLIPFDRNLFYTYQVDADLLNRKITLLDTPLFRAQLYQVFYPCDVPMALSYFGYCLYPDLPVHKVLGIFGRERVGKGTLGRVLKGIITHGFGSLNLARILTAERFQFTGIEGKNVLVDFELKRKFKRGTVKDWSAFNNLFGQDVLSIEKKGKEAQDRISKAKGIVIGNLPIFPVDDAAAIERWLPLVTKSVKPSHFRPNMDQEIIEREGDKVATLLVRVLFGLIDRGWIFPGQLTPESTVDLMERLADPVENFIDECTEPVEGITVEVNKAYNAFENWCEDKGITPVSAQTFKKSFGWTYPKKKYHRANETGYEFVGCVLIGSEDQDREDEGEKQSHFEGGTGMESPGTQKNGFRGNGYRQFQHVSVTKREEREKEDHEKYIKDKAHKLEPGNFTPKIRENKAPQENKSSSNLLKISERVPVKENKDSERETLRVSSAHPLGKTGLTVFSSIEAAAGILKGKQLNIVKQEPAPGEQSMHQFRIDGRMETLPTDTQNFVKEHFKVKFEGKENNDYVVIWARIKDMRGAHE